MSSDKNTATHADRPAADDDDDDGDDDDDDDGGTSAQLRCLEGTLLLHVQGCTPAQPDRTSADRPSSLAHGQMPCSFVDTSSMFMFAVMLVGTRVQGQQFWHGHASTMESVNWMESKPARPAKWHIHSLGCVMFTWLAQSGCSKLTLKYE